jgi:hypothetical protein
MELFSSPSLALPRRVEPLLVRNGVTGREEEYYNEENNLHDAFGILQRAII